MKKFLKKLPIILLAALVIIQFIPSGRPANQPVVGQDIFEIVEIPAEVGTLLINACYDCHSQAVKYPWYSYVAPVSWLIARDVNIGRQHLDFGKWEELTKRKQIKALGEIAEEVEDGYMPMQIYIILHSEAKLSIDQRELIVTWSEQLAEKTLED